MVLKCEDCGDPVDECLQCGYQFEEDDVTYCYLQLRIVHFHDLECLQYFLEIGEGRALVDKGTVASGG